MEATRIHMIVEALESELDKSRMTTFLRSFCRTGDTYLCFAAHAAVPALLTADLLYKIRFNFTVDRRGASLDIPYLAVSDVLLAPICKEVSQGVFAMHPDIRRALKLWLTDALDASGELRFGWDRLAQIAQFVLLYLEECPDEIRQPVLRQTLRWDALAVADPQAAGRDLLETVANALRNKDKLSLAEQKVSAAETVLRKQAAASDRWQWLAFAVNLFRGSRLYEAGGDWMNYFKRIEQELRAIRNNADGLKIPVPKAVLEHFKIGEEEDDGEPRTSLFAKIHLFIHQDLDKRQLVRQLFGWEFEKDQPLNCFRWHVNSQDLGPFFDIQFTVWAWDSSLPPELDRFVLTPGGYYFLVLPPEKLSSDSKDIFSLLYRIHSQVGRQDIWAVVPQKGDDAKKIQNLQNSFSDIMGLLPLASGEGFDSVLLGMLLQKGGGWIPSIELDETTSVRNEEWFRKTDQAGRRRFEAGKVPFYPGFESTSPSADANGMVEAIETARETKGRLTGKELEEADLLGELGLRYSHPQGGDWLPGLIQPTHWRLRHPELPATYLYYTLEFLPQDLPLRLYHRLIRAGAVADEKDTLLLYVYGVPVEMRVAAVGRKLEVRVLQVVKEDRFPQKTLFDSAAHALADLVRFEEQLWYGYDKARLAFEILSFRKESAFGRQLSKRFEEWQEACRLAAAATTESELRDYQTSVAPIISSTHAFLLKEKPETLSIPAADLIGLVRQTVERCVSPKNQRGGLLESYPFPIATLSQTLHIPAHATPDMIFIEGGTFRMGDVMGDNEYNDEKPVHDVKLNNFELGRYPVTMQEFDAFCEADKRDKPKDQGWGRGNRPVINVDWYDAVEYCNWLSKLWGLKQVYHIDKSKKDPNNRNDSDNKKWLVTPDWTADGYRLPTEAEWEYAARQRGQNVRFGNGKDVADPKEINFDASESYKKPYSVVGEYRGKTAPVGGLNSPNSLGLHDMSGNVYDWCWDWFDEKYYQTFKSPPADNPRGPDGGVDRVQRGGSWGSDPQIVRASGRSYDGPDDRDVYTGFRLARTL